MIVSIALQLMLIALLLLYKLWRAFLSWRQGAASLQFGPADFTTCGELELSESIKLYQIVSRTARKSEPASGCCSFAWF